MSTEAEALATLPPTSAATIRTMVICVPQEIPDTALTGRHLATHFGVTGTTSRRYWTTKLRPWQYRHIIDPRKGSPVTCAGGPVRLLDLRGTEHAAGIGAGLRHCKYDQLVRGTKQAAPWSTLIAKHNADPEKFPLQKVTAEFEAQPRVQAIMLHNAAVYGPDRFDLAELGPLQAGQVAYQHYRALTQICADAMLTETGQQLRPASDSVPDRTRYLQVARAHLDALDPDTRIVAITV